MLVLKDEQWAALKARDTQSFIAAVCEQFLVKRPRMMSSPGREVLQTYMQAAHDYAIRIGFTSPPHILRLMYLAADAPGIHDDAVVDAYLRKESATPEQRLDDLLAVVMQELKELERGA